MSDFDNRVPQQLDASTGGQIDAVCDAFEAGLQASACPRIEDYLVGWEEPERSKLLYELLLQELDYRLSGNQTIQEDLYRSRFPQDERVVDEAFRKLMAGENTVHTPRYGQTLGGETLVCTSKLSRLRYHDQGGLGVVYVAQDQQLKRDMAVKFIHDRLAEDKESRERFVLEAEITSRLEHPGVVPVHGLGRSPQGRLFYTMRFIHGERLDAAINRYHRLDRRSDEGRNSQVQFHALLNHFVAICHTIAYAHNRGIVHRDIKPQNVMLGRYGETIVIDWGLAIPVGRQGIFKQPSEQTLKPSSGSERSGDGGRGAGTPAYMSPEQAGASGDVGPASDIYSLGVTLYKILTGQLPFTASTAEEMKQQVLSGDFPRPTQAAKAVSKALEAICLKAMSLDPRRRYTTAMELAQDVDRYLADAPVLAYQEPVLRKGARWARRHRTFTQSLLAALVLLTVTGILGALWQGQQAQRQRQLHEAAEAARQSQYALRRHGLQVSAEFAARTIANQVDIRWRILEKEASDPQLAQQLTAVNVRPLDEQLWSPLQQWIDQRHEQLYPDIPCRSWFIQASDGTQVARSPSHKQTGERFGSLGDNFAFRDYFHGSGQDYPVNQLITPRPLSAPHNSTATRSTVEGDLVVLLSVPIRLHSQDAVLGVLGMSIELGSFADLKISLPDGQGVLLVETREYHMLSEDLTSPSERGEGLVLHHQDLHQVMLQNPSSLPHVSQAVLEHMKQSKKFWLDPQFTAAPLNNLLPSEYRDPVARDVDAASYLAAFAPVIVRGRPIQQGDTGWFVIVQQRQDATPP